MDKNIMVKNKIGAVKAGPVKPGPINPRPNTKGKIVKKLQITPFKSEPKKLITEKDTNILNEFMYVYFKNKINPTTYSDLIK
jgi:hypothetical protein